MLVKKPPASRTAKPAGQLLSLTDLPDADTRWVASRKQTVVLAVNQGLITRDEALSRYGLSGEEFDAWRHAHMVYGKAALKVTSISKYRHPIVDKSLGGHTD